MPKQDQNCLAPVMASVPTLNWGQDILEPRKQMWKPVAGDAPAAPLQAINR